MLAQVHPDVQFDKFVHTFLWIELDCNEVSYR